MRVVPSSPLKTISMRPSARRTVATGYRERAGRPLRAVRDETARLCARCRDLEARIAELT